MARHKDSPAKIDTLVRSLNLIPYFQSHPDRTVMEAAKDLGRDPGELLADLHRLSLCGVGSWPEELVDLTADYREVRITNSQGMDRALRLTPTEAGALLLTLESLEGIPGLTDREAVVSAAAKLRSILDPRAVAIFDSLATDDPAESTAQVILREAMQSDRRVRFTYRSASSDTETVRTVDPVRIFVNGGETYLAGWEEASGRHKNFRADRMSDMTVLDEQATPHLDRMPFDADDPFSFRTVAEHAHLLVRADATWLADYYPLELGQDRGDGMVEARMPVGSAEWFIRFVIGQSDRLTVTAPADLVEQVRHRAEAGLTAYDERPDR
ncbi:helix-turn-helix transcriptional regulator [Corynebacterium suedekumii]|uniref:WYL domain-containing protein n=1 Tax=Corynebacterium suedekumii TaxID=3049801 RepID=A0ABY8VJP4_9CORY|nr:WYL domain-containing protein [Corynebacterium suedekumii]WIM69733.1 WYL domain-containing protein [Corynebacterium suedekumii]